MRKSYIIFSFLVIASMILAACGPTDAADTGDTGAADTSDDSGDAMAAPEFKNEDTYVQLTFGDPETLDPAWTYETAGSGLQFNMYEAMVFFEREKTDSFVPTLSTGWTVSDDGAVYSFDAREGVTFHAGGTFEPHDAAYSMHRALLQDRVGGPHWMTHEAFFGTFAMEDTAVKIAADAAKAADVEAGIDVDAVDDEGVSTYEPTPFCEEPADEEAGCTYAELSEEQLVAACEAVKATVVADDAAGTVTYTLTQATPWFLAMMANSFVGSVVDMEWMVEQGAWDGDCATWTDFKDPAADATVLFNEANGTGPYMLDHWTPGEEIVLVANPNYWREEGDAMWEGGPSGVASIDRYVRLNVTEWGTRFAIFEAGDADNIGVDAQYNSQMEPLFAERCDITGACTADDAGGWVTAYLNLPRPVMTPAQFNQQLVSEGGNVFQGSGELDGNGIPDDFFADIHIRKAFSYCFDYDTFIEAGLDGEGVQAQGPIIQDMLGYRDDGFMYSYDLDKCAEEFAAADTDVLGTGFWMQMGYNLGNDTRRLAAEVLKAGIESVSPNFTIEAVAMPWPVLLNARRAGKLPIYIGGWAEDFHDPHNWVHPFLHSQGAYGAVMKITPDVAAEFDALIAQGAALTSAEERRPIYEELQLKAQEEAPAIWMYQPAVRVHFSPWIEGWYFNPAYPSITSSYIYAMDKVGP